MLAIDTETRIATDEEPVPRLVSVAAFDGVQGWLLHRTDQWLPLVEYALRSGWIGANVPYDMFVLAKEKPELWPLILEAYNHDCVFDVLTREKMIDTAEGMYRMRGGYDLGSVSERHPGIEAKDAGERWRMHFGELEDVPIAFWPADAQEYALGDPEKTFRVWQSQQAHQYADIIFRDAPRQARGHLALYAQTLRGVHTDPAAVADLERRLDKRIMDLALRLNQAGLVRVGGTRKAPRFVKTVKAAQASLQHWAAYTGQTERLVFGKKGPSLKEDALRSLRIPDDHPLRDYQVYGTILNSRSKNIPPLRHPIVRTRYDEFVSTGRVSSSAPDEEAWHGTNFQNQPTPRTITEWGLEPAADWLLPPNTPEKKRLATLVGIGFRECFVPPPGWVFVISDWAGLELVPLAQTHLDWFGQSSMADAMRAGKDLHSMFAATLLRVDYSGFDKENPEHKKKRDLAKKWNFGRWGGMGDPKFQQLLAQDGVYMDLGEIREYTVEWKGLWVEASLYFRKISEMAGLDGYITIALPRTGLIRGRCKYTEACNFPFQGTAAAAMKDALWGLFLAGMDPASPMFGAYQAIVVHDENVTACPRHQADAVLHEQERIMRVAVAGVCPDVPVGIETTIRERYTK